MTSRPVTRVLVVSHYYPPHVGGLEVVAREVAEGLVTAGHSVEVLTSACGASPGKSTESGVGVRRIPAWNGFERTIGVPFPIFSPSLIVRAWTMVRKADVVQIHDMLYLTSWVSALMCLLMGKPYVVTQHVGLVAHSLAIVRWIQLAVHRTLGGFVLRGAKQIIPINSFIEASTLRLLPTAPTTVLRNGVNTDRYRPASSAEGVHLRQKYGLPPEGLLFFYVGRFVPKKGFDLVASCTDDAYTLVFVGGERPELMAPDPRRIFLGSRGPDEVAELYRTADLFISASVGESPLTVLEAMNSGVGVLLNADPGLQALNLVGDGVRWLEMGPHTLQAELRKLAADPRLLERMGEAAATTAAQSFSWGHHVEALTDIFVKSCGVIPPQSATRVAVVVPYYSPKVGGVEQYAQAQVRALQADPRFDPVVITTGTRQKTVTTVEDGVETIRLSRGLILSNTPLDPRWLWQLPRLLTHLHIDVVSAHAPVPGLADLALRTAGSRPTVLTYHSGSLVKQNTGSVLGVGIDLLLKAYERWVLPRGFARANRLIGVSPASLAMGHGATMITPGVNTSLFVPGPIPTGPPTLLYVGRIERASAWKGVEVLIRAFARVRDGFPDSRLRLVGGGDAVSELQQLARALEVDSALDWIGPLDHDDLVGHYHRASVLVLPSLTESESFGMTLIEAMACGRPVIASHVGGTPFVVTDGVDGVLVKPGDAEALASAITEVLKDPDRAAAMGRSGRRTVEQRFSWDTITAAMLTVFQDLDQAPADLLAQER